MVQFHQEELRVNIALFVFKKLHIVVILLLLLMVVGPSPAAAQDITMQVEAGVGGWYRYGQWVPLRVTVDSPRSVDGQLQVRIGSASTTATGFETTYATPFSIVGGDTRRVFLYVSLNNLTTSLQVELVNGDGEIISTQETRVRQANSTDVIFAVVTNSTSGFINVQREPVARGNSYQINWTPDNIPPNANALQGVDVMVFHNANTDQMDTAQIEAVTDWVAGGGHVIITGGSGYQANTDAFLGSLLPLDLESSVTLDDVTVFGDFLGVSTEDFDSGTTVAVTIPDEDAAVLLEADDIPLLVRDYYAMGTVDFMAVDPNDEPLRNWVGTDMLWRELIMTGQPRPGWTYGVQDFTLAQDAASNVTGFDLPGVVQLGLFLIGYILLIGPINYILLNAVRRREIAWITIPVLILAFTVAAYFTGFSLRGDAVTINQVSVVQFTDDQERARVDAVVGVLSPRRTTYDVNIGEDLNLRTLPDVAAPASVTEINISQGSQDVAEGIPVDAAIMTSFATSGYIDKPEISGEALWLLRGGETSAIIDGEVFNGLDVPLEDAVVLVDGFSTEIGEIPAGGTADFSLNVPLEAHPRLLFGRRTDNRSTSPRFISSSFYSDVRCNITSTTNVFYGNVMGGQEFECSGGDDDDRRLRRRALMTAAINNEYSRNGGRGNGVYLVGWTEEPTLDVEISNTDQLLDGSVMYIYKIPTRFENRNDNRVTIPPGLISWTAIEITQPGRLPDIPVYDNLLSFALSLDQSVAIRFAPLPNLPVEDITEAELSFNWRKVTTDIELTLWNWDTGEWEVYTLPDLDRTQHLITLDDEYIGPQHVVHVAFASTDPNVEQNITDVSLILRGTR